MKTAGSCRIAFFNPRTLICFALCAAGLVLALAPVSNAVAGDNTATELSASVPAQATGGIWTATGDLGAPRDQHTATLLPNDQMLLAGGERSVGVTLESLASAQLYHPAIGRWQRVANMNHKRHGHTETLLPNGQVLVTGGAPCGDACSPDRRGSAELYDPTTRTWTDTGSMASARWFHTETLLPNGQVLVVGGSGRELHDSGDLVTAELYDPATGMWTPTGSTTTPHAYHTATLLPSGHVLVAGSIASTTMQSAELYDPATGVWTPTGDLTTARVFHAATLLPNGQVLVAGGASLETAELYDPVNGMWTPTASMTTPRSRHTATLLPNGQVLVAGGRGHDTPPFTSLVSAELYESAPEALDIH